MDTHYMFELEEILCSELEQLYEKVKHEQLTSSSLDMIDKLSHSIKSIDTILAMKGYTSDNSRSYRNYNRDGMGRFSSRDNYASRDNLRDEIMAKLNQYEMMK